MPIYKQTLRFEREVEIEAKCASDANAKLFEIVHDAEWGGSVDSLGHYDFEDEPIECPMCKGEGLEGEDVCSQCNGDGQIPFPQT